VSSLSDWTDVLHLSTKWQFDAIRSAAVQAISSLASPIDKIAIGRAYDVDAWIHDALVDVLLRKNDLTLEEAQRLPLEDVVAIASGRRRARTEVIKTRTQVEEVARELLTSKKDDAISKDVPTADLMPISDETQDQVHHRIMRWTRMLDDQRKNTFVVAITRTIQEHPNCMDFALEQLLRKGFPIVERHGSDGVMMQVLQAISRDTQLQVAFPPCFERVYLSLVSNWDQLMRLPLSEPFTTGSDATFKELFVWTKYTVHIRNHLGGKVFFVNLFRLFWSRMLVASEHILNSTLSDPCQVIQAVLEQIGQHAYWPSATIEIDDFFEMLENVRDVRKDNAKLVNGLTVRFDP
jgi:hypothetical protein